ncbi:MAG: polysaccharide deacetylase family protein [Gemmatimonadota bacterium]|nr:polysaccharide deacetylase family protein [Gemmatimonadota bacterium]
MRVDEGFSWTATGAELSAPVVLLKRVLATVAPAVGAALACLLLLPGATRAQQERAVAITIDDLPYVGGPQELARASHVADGMLAALCAAGAPAHGFVTGKRVLVEDEVDERIELLRRWRDTGARLENHGWSHRSFHDTPFDEYVDDVARGGLFPEFLAAEVGDSVGFYRHPFNHTGSSLAVRRAFEAWLVERGMKLAPFTVEHADYVFNALYLEAERRGDEDRKARIVEAYLDQLDTAFAFAERLSVDTFGREIPQVFLIHANALNGAVLDRMVERLRSRGYRFVSLEKALADPAYRTEDLYVGRTGISWLHRWRVGLGLPDRLREAPDPPGWVLEAYRAR